MKQFIWEVIPTSIPLFRKKCSKCSSSLYYCSGKFRMNSQKKNIDVWLIYRCEKCDTTCNITILSRTRPDLIDKDLYRKFSHNDEATAWKYAFDPEIISKNKMELDHTGVKYNIVHDPITFDEMLATGEERIEFRIKTAFPLNLKLTTVIRECLSISLNQLEKMLSAGVIGVHPENPVRKAKVKDGVIVTVYSDMLRAYNKEKD